MNTLVVAFPLGFFRRFEVIHQLIRAMPEVHEGLIPLGVGNPDRCADPLFVEGGFKTLQELFLAIVCWFTEENGEFIATDPCGDVLAANHCFQGLARTLEKQIASWRFASQACGQDPESNDSQRGHRRKGRWR